MIVILGAGLAGLSSSYHLGHESCLLLEKSGQLYGHIGSEQHAGFTWDQGPHVSFTKSDYVREMFADSVQGHYDEYEVRIGNYYRGNWIDHPAQTALHQVPEPLRSECLASFMEARSADTNGAPLPRDYLAWLDASLGVHFTRSFPAVYTRKYWTVDASELTTSWVGSRVLKPAMRDVIDGSRGPLTKSNHYISKVRYPRAGGYQSFAYKLAQGANVRFGAEVVSIDLKGHRVYLANGDSVLYDTLINTLPLPVFVQACQGIPPNVRDAVAALSCTQLALVNVAVPHLTLRPENWIYVYDEDKLSTRINCTEKLTAGNAPPGWSGVQTEVYFSRHRPLAVPLSELAGKVFDELCEMGLVSPAAYRQDAEAAPSIHTRFVPWANVIFNHETAGALEVIWDWLSTYGLARQDDDTHPLTDWSEAAPSGTPTQDNCIFMAGRFGQWKYFWTDDCVLRGQDIGRRLATT